MPDSTSALINQLTNPPNPYDKFGGTIDFANKLMDYRANQAASDAYRQSIDPETGAFDQGKFNALTSQAPGGSWQFGRRMFESGQGYGAQGQATTANTDAARGQLTLLNGYLTPLIEKANSGQQVTADEVRSVLANAYGLSPQTLQGVETRLANLAPGQVNGALRGFSFAAQTAGEQAARTSPTIGQNIELAQTLWTPKDYPDPADPTQTKHGTIGSYLVDTGGDPNGTIRRMMSGGYAPGAGGPSVGASKGGAVGGGKGGAPGPQSSAGSGTGDDPRELVPYIRQAAIARGIDPDVAVKVAASEGLTEFSGDGGQSGGAFQLHVTPDNKGGHVGDRFMADTGLDPRDPKNEKATIDYALDTAAKNGWGEWNGAKRIGITGFAGIGKPPTQTASAPAAPTDTTPGDNGYPFPTLTPGQAANIPPVRGQKSAVVAPPLPPNTTNWAGGSLPMSTALPPSSDAAAAVGQPSGAWPGGQARGLVAGGGAQVPTPPIQLASNFPIGGGYSTPTTLPTTTEDSANLFKRDRALFYAFPDRVRPLEQASDLLRTHPSLGTGTGTTDMANLQNLAQTFGFKLSAAANDNLAALTEINKDLERYYQNIPGANRSDLAQAETKMSNPTVEMQREALEDLLARTIGRERMNQAAFLNFQQSHGVNNAANYASRYADESGQYINQFDPVGFAFERMTVQQRKAYLDSLPTDAARDRYKKSIKEASRLFPELTIPRQ